MILEDVELEGDFYDNSYYKDLYAFLEDQIKQDKNKHFAHLANVNEEQLLFTLYIDPNVFGLSEFQSDAWGMDLSEYIGISLTFFTTQGQEEKHPKVEVYQIGDTYKKDVHTGSKRKFLLYWTIGDRILFSFFGKKNWPFSEILKSEDKNLLKNLVKYTEQVILNSSKKCMICEDVLPSEGLRPSICPKQLCVFRHEQFGLGVDLENAILNTPDIVDLMVTMAYSGATQQGGSFDSFDPFPSGVEIKIKDKMTMQETTYDFLKNGVNDKGKVAKLIENIPKVSKLNEWVKKGILKEECAKISPLIYPFLRWLLASNRCFLKLLPKDQRMNEMSTDYQYVMLSSTPEKEIKFNLEKKKYGSFYAWHGSALHNWHAILRNGLKNMSGTKGQVNGAAYGSVILTLTKL